MGEYHQLKQTLLVGTAILSVILFGVIWIAFSLTIALNYLLGAGVGFIYMGLLARDVERLGEQKKRLSGNRLALFVGLILLATRVDQLEILPIFLGFITYKGMILMYALQSAFGPLQKNT